MGRAGVEEPRGTVVPESTGILSALSFSMRASVRSLGLPTAEFPLSETPRMETVEDERSPAWYAWSAISSALLSVTMAGDVMPVYSDAESPPPPPPHPNRRNTASKHTTADGARFVMTVSLLWKRVVAIDCRLFSKRLPIVSENRNPVFNRVNWLSFQGFVMPCSRGIRERGKLEPTGGIEPPTC